MAHILETSRLILKEFEISDAAFILELLNTESWIKYIGDRNVHTVSDAISYLQNGPISSYQKNGFGLWLVELKDPKMPIGMCGLIKRDDFEYPDIGFAFLPSFTGKGFAYEIAKPILDWANVRPGFESILAITVPENSSSIKLLRKLGLSLIEEIVRGEEQELLLKFSTGEKR